MLVEQFGHCRRSSQRKVPRLLAQSAKEYSRNSRSNPGAGGQGSKLGWNLEAARVFSIRFDKTGRPTREARDAKGLANCWPLIVKGIMEVIAYSVGDNPYSLSGGKRGRPRGPADWIFQALVFNLHALVLALHG